MTQNLDLLCSTLRPDSPAPDAWDAACSDARSELKTTEEARAFYSLLQLLLPRYGRSHTRFLNLPLPPARYQTRSRLAKRAAPHVYHSLSPRGLGLIRFEDFSERSGAAFKEYQAALAALRDAPALLLDLRGNRGGHIDTPRLVASTLIRHGVQPIPSPGLRPPSGSTSLTTGPGSAGRGEPPLDPHPEIRVDKPVAVLVDGKTESAAEYLALLLQKGGLPLLGARTAGLLVADKTVFDLPCGLRVEAGLGSYLRRDGKPVDGNGLEPDVASPPAVAVAAAERLLLDKNDIKEAE